MNTLNESLAVAVSTSLTPRGADGGLVAGSRTTGRELAPPSIFVVVCAWCQSHMRGPIVCTQLIAAPPAWLQVSHGVCTACAEAAKRELESMRIAK